MAKSDNALVNPRADRFFAQHGNRTFSPLLTDTEKMDVAQTGSPFTVLKVTPSATKEYGDCWSLDIQLDGQPDVRGIMFSRGKPFDVNRDEMLTALAENIAEYGPMDAVRLHVTTTNNGRDYFYLGAADNTEQLPF